MPDVAVRGSLLGFAVAVVALAALALNGDLFADRQALIAIQVLAFLLMVWARVTFGRRSFHAAANPTSGGLVTAGPYRYWRHPIYAAVIFFTWAGVIAHRHASSALLGAVVTAGMFARMVAEERLLRRQYPDYSAYAARTGRLIPWLL